MCPDVPGLGVDSEDAPEAGAERRHWWPVAVKQEVVVLQPVGEHVVGDDTPPALPHLVSEETKRVALKDKCFYFTEISTDVLVVVSPGANVNKPVTDPSDHGSTSR